MNPEMTLYSAPSSYYSMIARLALVESGAAFQIRRMDIHISKEQLQPWYLAINPAMTVPAMTEGAEKWIDSRAILGQAAAMADIKWCDSDPKLLPEIQKIVAAHYELSIERLTFGKAMSRILPLRLIFPHMLKGIIAKLEASLPVTDDPKAVQDKIKLNQERLAYFTEGDRAKKLEMQREEVRHFLSLLPQAPSPMLFDERPGSADIVTAILCARLQMIGELDLLKPFPKLEGWYDIMKTRPSFKQADVWTHFQPWRIVLRY